MLLRTCRMSSRIWKALVSGMRSIIHRSIARRQSMSAASLARILRSERSMDPSSCDCSSADVLASSSLTGAMMPACQETAI